MGSFVSLLAIGGLILAQPVPFCSDSEHCSVEIKKGEVAPYTGQLLSTELAISLGTKAEFCGKRCDLELEFQQKTLKLDLVLEKKLRGMDQKAWKEQKDLLLKRLEESHSTPFYTHPIFISAVTVVFTVLAIWGAKETLLEK